MTSPLSVAQDSILVFNAGFPDCQLRKLGYNQKKSVLIRSIRLIRVLFLSANNFYMPFYPPYYRLVLYQLPSCGKIWHSSRYNGTSVSFACQVFAQVRGFFIYMDRLNDQTRSTKSTFCRTAILDISPPEFEFYSKKLVYRGIPIKAHEVVADAALWEARDRLNRMLRNIPNALKNLVAEGAELHIIGKDQVTSDLPEHRHLKGKPYDGELTIDERTRGVGGKLASCGEENLLKLSKDRYLGRDICIHEFAHTLYRLGLSPDVREMVREQFVRSTEAGLWKTAYASRNQDEFFCELSMWYFGTHGDYAEISPKPRPGREWFQQYDPEAFEVIDRIYSGRAAITSTR